MKTLLILDPIKKLDLQFDSSLYLIRELHRRNHQSWMVDTPGIFANEQSVFALASQVQPRHFKKTQDPLKTDGAYDCSKAQIKALSFFDLILVRKEPPFDLRYFYLTQLLDRVKSNIAVSNDPLGIRNTNEKLGCFLFPSHCPQSMISSQPQVLLDFTQSLGKDVVLKPLNERAGYGVKRLPFGSRNASAIVRQMVAGGKELILAQEFIGKKPYRDKRVTLLNGEILFVYEKRARKGDFRANISQGGSVHPAQLTADDKKVIADVKPYLKAQNIHLAGLDLLDGKLIDLNVTCPGGFTDAKSVHPKLAVVEAWADFLEDLALGRH